MSDMLTFFQEHPRYPSKANCERYFKKLIDGQKDPSHELESTLWYYLKHCSVHSHEYQFDDKDHLIIRLDYNYFHLLSDILLWQRFRSVQYPHIGKNDNGWWRMAVRVFANKQWYMMTGQDNWSKPNSTKRASPQLKKAIEKKKTKKCKPAMPSMTVLSTQSNIKTFLENTQASSSSSPNATPPKKTHTHKRLLQAQPILMNDEEEGEDEDEGTNPPAPAPVYQGGQTSAYFQTASNFTAPQPAAPPQVHHQGYGPQQQPIPTAAQRTPRTPTPDDDSVPARSAELYKPPNEVMQMARYAGMISSLKKYLMKRGVWSQNSKAHWNCISDWTKTDKGREYLRACDLHPEGIHLDHIYDKEHTPLYHAYNCYFMPGSTNSHFNKLTGDEKMKYVGCHARKMSTAFLKWYLQKAAKLKIDCSKFNNAQVTM